MIVYSYIITLIIIDPTFQLMTFQSYMKELEMSITLENTPVHSFLPHINSLLHNAELTCTDTMPSETSCTEQFKSKKIAPK